MGMSLQEVAQRERGAVRARDGGGLDPGRIRRANDV